MQCQTEAIYYPVVSATNLYYEENVELICNCCKYKYKEKLHLKQCLDHYQYMQLFMAYSTNKVLCWILLVPVDEP